ncbi:MAG TPA: hypothetical protein VFE05_01425 [Longimicrobiaceae bacterium]|nr:hypothetical protein [Longimicrobiaceae bacterium]
MLLSGDRRRERQVSHVALGADTSAVAAALGRPGRACPTGSLDDLAEQFPGGTPPAQAESTLDRLRPQTARRWVYAPGSGAASCAPQKGATQFGLDPQGRVVWYVAVTGRTPVVFPDTP